jgi:cellulose synthase/poly-beta-1,6-N-acetylglucosamine synthase-like glycosyltransferase
MDYRQSRHAIDPQTPNCPLPKVSVIIPSLHGPDPALLESLKRQTAQPDEVEVVLGVRPNGRARNVGVAHTRGERLVFIDDDAVLAHEDVIARMLPLLDDPTVGVVGASRLVHPDAPKFQQRVAKQVARINNPVVKKALETNPHPPYRATEVTTTCAAMRRAVFEETGGFSETLIRGVDTEFFLRVRKLGYRFILAPQAWTWHPAPATLKKLLRKHFLYGLGHAQTTQLHPEMTRRLERYPLPYLFLRTLMLPLHAFLPYSFGDPRMRLTFAPLKALASYASAVGYVYGKLVSR